MPLEGPFRIHVQPQLGIELGCGAAACSERRNVSPLGLRHVRFNLPLTDWEMLTKEGRAGLHVSRCGILGTS